jgi:serine/threonine protein kinase
MNQSHQLDAYWKTLGTKVVLELAVYLRALRTYQSNNALVTNSQSQLLSTLTTHFAGRKEPVHLQFLECETFINSSLIGMGFQEFSRASELARMLRGFGVGEVIFSPETSAKSLTELADSVSDAIHKRREGLPAQVDQIALRPLHAGSMGGTRTETHKVCVWLFAGMLNAMEGLQQVHDGGLVPQMLPFKRHLRLTAEIMADRSTVFQLLTANRAHRMMDGDALHCTLRTFDVLGFGTALGLSRLSLLSLGLSSVLDQLTANQGTEDMFESISKIQSLGDMAPGVLMNLWDLELIRENGKGGHLAQILDVVDHYVRLTHEQRKERQVAELWAQLHRLAPRSRSIVNQFQAWKGTLPTGAIVQHPDLGQALVIDQAGQEGTPRLSSFTQWGVLSDPVEVPTTEIGGSSLGPIHALRLPTDDRTPTSELSKSAPFPLPESYGRKALTVGDVFGGKKGKRFEVISVAGQGAQATVFRAKDSRLERVVASKVSSVPSPTMRAKQMERFERELRLSSRVNHPHVLQVYDCGELEGGTPYMLVEWMEKGELSALLHACWSIGQHLPINYIHYYALSIASAMRAVHQAQIVHRDVKPANVLIRADGVVKLTDFGIAKDLSLEANLLTEMGQTVGTLGYMAPEQLVGLPGPQSDIFSFGITLYQMLTSDLPVQQVKNAIPTGHILDEAWDVVPAAWINLLKRLTASDLDERAVTFDEVCRLLMAVDVGQPDSRDLLRRSLLPPFPSRELQSISGSYSTPTPAESDSVLPSSPPPPENDTVIIDDVELD